MSLSLETYKSLADAGSNNLDNLSYQQILRKCNGYTKNNENIIWCYETDYLFNNINKHEQVHYKHLNEFTEKELLNIYNEHLINNISVRNLSEKYSIHFSTLLEYIKKINQPISEEFNINTIKFVICKKTKKQFLDVVNKSGALTIHISNTYPDFKIESKFKRKQIEIKTGKPWYYDFFDFEKF